MKSGCAVVVDHSTESVARAIHAVQMSAYEQEAQLLGVADLPPLTRTVDDIRTCAESFLVVLAGSEVAGSISVEPDAERAAVRIVSLTVAPAFQRRGIGTALLAEVLRRHGAGVVTVQAAAANLPVLRLYKRLGFVESGRWVVSQPCLELVKLQRLPAVVPGSVAHAV